MGVWGAEREGKGEAFIINLISPPPPNLPWILMRRVSFIREIQACH